MPLAVAVSTEDRELDPVAFSGKKAGMTEQQQRRLPPCGLCGGTQVGNLELNGQGVGLYSRGRGIWRGAQFPVAAVACLGCGHISFFVEELEHLRSEVNGRPQKYSW